MGTYTVILDKKQQILDSDSDEFQNELLSLTQNFRSFEDGLDTIILEHGYEGDINDNASKTSFIREKFIRHKIAVPRELNRWYAEKLRIKRSTAFQLCFALELTKDETVDFFQRILLERSFDCHDMTELVYYYCFLHGKSFLDAQEILNKLPENYKKGNVDLSSEELLYTDVIRDEVEDLESEEELIGYIEDNIGKFKYNNASGCDVISRLWENIAGLDGIAVKEAEIIEIEGEDGGIRLAEQKKAGKKISDFDIYLAILGMDPVEVSKLSSDHRTIKPILERLHPLVQDSFPDRDGLNKILSGKHVSYERVRKTIILLAFYKFWAEWRIANKEGIADKKTRERAKAAIDSFLLQGGYESLYIGNPYDFIFVLCGNQDDPLEVFREIMGELLISKLEENKN